MENHSKSQLFQMVWSVIVVKITSCLGARLFQNFKMVRPSTVEVIEVEVLSHEKVGVYLNVIKLMVSVFPTCLLPSKEDETYIIFVT